jgi:hypothetical protein
MRLGKRTFISGDNRCVETKEPPTEAIRYRSRVATASELAARDIENLSDKAQPAEERVRRKRSLISGLENFATFVESNRSQSASPTAEV